MAQTQAQNPQQLNERIQIGFSTQYPQTKVVELSNAILQYFADQQFDEWQDVIDDICNGYDDCCCKEILFKELDITNIKCKLNEYKCLKQCVEMDYKHKTVQVIIKIPQQKPILTEIESFATISQLKQKICIKNNINYNQFNLLMNPHSNPKQLDINRTINDYGITYQTLLCLIWNPMDIYIQCDDSRTVLNGIRFNDTIYGIKLRYSEHTGISHHCFRFEWKGKRLNNDYSLYEYGIGVNGILCVVWIFSAKYLNDLLFDDRISIICNQDIEWKRSESQKVYKQFMDSNNDSLNIVGFYKINKNYGQNLSIYQNLRKLKTNDTEAMLFHGTSLDNISKIIENGFNRDYNKRHLYGMGTYFSKYSHIAAQYCSEFGNDTNLYAMLCCRTLIGAYTAGKLFMRKSELYQHDHVTQYDSLVDDIYDPSIFVINRDYHSVPCYIIVFSCNTS